MALLVPAGEECKWLLVLSSIALGEFLPFALLPGVTFGVLATV